MKNRWKILIGVVIVVVLVVILRTNNKNKFILENKEKINQIHFTQTSLFETAEEVVDSIITQKSKNLKLLDDLNGEVEKKSSELTSTKSKLNQYLIKIEDMESTHDNHTQVIDSLKKQLSSYKILLKEKKIKIKSLEDSLLVKNVEIESFKTIEDSLEIGDSLFIMTDTIHEIDTTSILKKSIRFLKLRK